MQDALKLGLFTGQRRGDILRMTWSCYDGKGINLVQQKTGRELWIPALPQLKEMLDAKKQGERKALSILTLPSGRPLTKDIFKDRWRKAIIGAGLDGYTFHGLRYTATALLFEAGATPQEAAAITGHKSWTMLEKYGRSAQQKHLAQAAITKLIETNKRTNIGKPE
jgi:integrase